MPDIPDQRRRRILGAAALSCVSHSLPIAAQPARMRRLGILSGHGRNREFEAFRLRLLEALGSLGYVEGKNIVIEWRLTDNDQARNAPLAMDLVNSGVDALLTQGTPRTRALQHATSTIPIVTGVGDPVGSGFAKTLAKPGGNITGLSYADTVIAQKQIELLREMAPAVRRVLIFRLRQYGNVSELNEPLVVAARQAGITSEVRAVSGFDEFEMGLNALRGSLTGAAFIPDDFRLEIDPSKVAEVAIRNRVATFCYERVYVENGSLMSYTLYHPDELQRISGMLDKVFRGIDPAGIPFELPSKSLLVLNRRAAAALGLAIPTEILLRADEIIQ